FFFEAGDGRRDELVTGVQACAVPISRQRQRGRQARVRSSLVCALVAAALLRTCSNLRAGSSAACRVHKARARSKTVSYTRCQTRSEERRVGQARTHPPPPPPPTTPTP